MEFNSDLAFQILSGIAVAATAIIGTIYALKQKNEDLKHSHFESQISKLVTDVDKLKTDTVRVDYLRRIDEDMEGLRSMIQQTREEFVKKSDLRETEARVIDAIEKLEKRVTEGASKKVDISHCQSTHHKGM